MSSQAMYDLYVVLMSLWACCSVAANLSVIFCIWKTSKRHRKPAAKSTDVLLVGLAVIDILLAGTVLPPKISHVSHTGHFFECKYQGRGEVWLKGEVRTTSACSSIGTNFK